MLASETGKPLVQHVVDQVRQCKNVSDVVVATDDQRIVAALRSYGTRCIFTDPHHPSGTDRVAEVARQLGGEADCVVNVQGDEPEIEPGTIDALAELIEEGRFGMWTAATPFKRAADASDPNLVKVVVSQTGRAMYFSRAAIPHLRDANSRDNLPPLSYYLHVGIYAYQRDVLLRLAGLKPTPCEQTEKLEQLRALEHDIEIGVTFIEHAAHGIDTPQQYRAFVDRYQVATNQE